MTLWPDFKFGTPLFNDLTFDHWMVVEAVLVPIDSVCLSSTFIWQVELLSEFNSVEVAVVEFCGVELLSAEFSWEVSTTAVANSVVDLAVFEWQVSLTAELKCK
jgi:hypothetical protein